MGDQHQTRLGAEIQAAFAEQDWPGALSLVDMWTSLYPKHAQGWYWRAGCLMRVERLAEALEDAERASALAPDDENISKLRQRLEQRVAGLAEAGESGDAEEEGAESREEIAACPADPTPQETLDVGAEDAPEELPAVESVPSESPEDEADPVVEVPSNTAPAAPPRMDETAQSSPTAGVGARREPPAPRPSSARRGPTVSSGARSRPQRRELLKQRLRNLPWATIACLAVIVVAVGGTIIQRSRVPDLAVNEKEASAIRKKIYASVVPAHPEVVAKAVCDPARVKDYVRVFGGYQPNPREWEEAKFCLEIVATADTIPGLLDILRPNHRRWGGTSAFGKTSRRGTTTDLRSVLVRIGEKGMKPLVTALGDEDEDVRLIAAEALAYQRTEEASRALIRNCRSSNEVVREVASGTLADLVGGGRVSPAEAFEVLEWLAADESPDVRRNVAETLEVFTGSVPRQLAEAMTADPDGRVGEAAQRSLRSFGKQ